MNIPWPSTPGELGLAVLTVIGAALAAWKRMSATRLGVKRDSVEGDTLSMGAAAIRDRMADALKERDELRAQVRDGFTRQITDAGRIATLEARNEALLRELELAALRFDESFARCLQHEDRIRRLLVVLRDTLPEETRRLIPSEFGGLGG